MTPDHRNASTFQTAKPTRPAVAKMPSEPPPVASSLNLLQTLVRELLAAVRSQGDAPRFLPAEAEPWTDESKCLLLDVEVDGVRCLLIKRIAPTVPRCTTIRICLSPREQEITRLIAQGHPNKAIADILDISTWTVNTHLRRIFAKFGVSSRAAMVARFLRHSSKDVRVH